MMIKWTYIQQGILFSGLALVISPILAGIQQNNIQYKQEKTHQKATTKVRKKQHARSAKFGNVKINQLQANCISTNKLAADNINAGRAEVNSLEVKTGPSTFNGDATFRNDVAVEGALLIKTPARTVTVGPDGDFATIQEAIDQVHGQVAYNYTINVQPGTYNEHLSFRGGGVTESFLINGDMREGVGITYINGDINATFPIAITDEQGAIVSYFPPVGTKHGKVSLEQNTGNDVTILITAAPTANVFDPDGAIIQPDFVAAGIVPGDRIILMDGFTQVLSEHTITAIKPGGFEFDGPEVNLSAEGSSLTICPNVVVSPTGFPPPDGPVDGPVTINANGAAKVSMRGIRVSTPVDLGQFIFAGVYVFGGAAMTMRNCVLDDIGYNTILNMLVINGSMNFSETELPNRGPVSLLGSFVNVVENGLFTYVDLYIIGALIYSFELFQGSMIGATLHSSGSFNTAINNYSGNTMLGVISGIFSTPIGINLGAAANCTNEWQTATFANCDTAISCKGSHLSIGQIPEPGPTDIYPPNGVVFKNCNVALNIIGGSTFSTQGPLNYVNVTHERVVEAGSTYVNVSDDPAGSFKYTQEGSAILDSTAHLQLITAPDAVTLSLDPATIVFSEASPDGIEVYVGKQYTLTSTTPFAHQLLLTSGTFIGAGSGTTATFDGEVSGETIVFTVISPTEVLITSLVGVTIS